MHFTDSNLAPHILVTQNNDNHAHQSVHLQQLQQGGDHGNNGPPPLVYLFHNLKGGVWTKIIFHRKVP